MTVLNHGLLVDGAGRPRARPRARARGADGRRGTAPRAGRDRDRELRLAGDGPHRRDRPTDVPAGPRHEGVAPVRGRRGRSRACPPTRASTTRTTATTRRACCATSRRSRSSPRSPTASRTTSARCDPAGWRTSSCGSPAFFGVKPEWVFKGGFPAWGPLGEGNATLERAEPTRYRADWARRPDGGARGVAVDVRLGVRSIARRCARAPGDAADAACPIGGVRGLTRAARSTPTARPPRSRSTSAAGAVSLGGRPLAVDAGLRGPAQPPLPAALARMRRQPRGRRR